MPGTALDLPSVSLYRYSDKISLSIQNHGGNRMDLHSVAVATGYLGAALGVSMVVPQIVRTFRNRALPGVSAMSWALTALACTSWLLYGLRTDEVPQVPGNVLLVSGAVVIVLAVPSATSVPVRAMRLAGPALAIAGLAVVLPSAGLGFLAFAIGLFSALPQTIRSLRRRSQDASAVSVLAWVLRVASQACWLIYAVALHDIAVTVSASVLLSSALLIITTELRRPVRSTATGLAVAC
jgi:uncharacterized protein with PQ loop repeat